MTDEEMEFLQNSNAIAGEFRAIALDDAALAWKFAKTRREGICARNVRGIHAYLMRRINPEIAGMWREGKGKTDTRRGFLTEIDMDGWTIYWFPETSEKRIEAAHAHFEQIRPFRDGNGRVGRILMNIQRLNAGLPVKTFREERDVGAQ